MQEDIKKEIIALLSAQNISVNSNVDFNVNGETVNLSYKFIIDSYMQASQEAQLVFLAALRKSQKAGNIGIEKFFEGMGKLLLMGSLSDKL